jgi:hypothetical protein
MAVALERGNEEISTEMTAGVNDRVPFKGGGLPYTRYKNTLIIDRFPKKGVRSYFCLQKSISDSHND